MSNISLLKFFVKLNKFKVLNGRGQFSVRNGIVNIKYKGIKKNDMNRLKARILRFLPEERKFLNQIYSKLIDDHSYLWSEVEDKDLAKLRYILMVIIKLFYEEHKHLHDVSQIDQQEFNRAVKELISNPDALMQKAKSAQIKAIDRLGLERWFNAFRKDIEKINQIIQKYEQAQTIQSREIEPMVFVSHIQIPPGHVTLIKQRKAELAVKVQRKVGDKVLNYSVIDGEKIKRFIPYLFELVKRFKGIAEELFKEPLELLHDKAGVNINFVEPGGEQGFHHDRNEVTCLLYLTTAVGGALEYINSKGEIKKFPARTGNLVVLVGANRILHRVAPVKKGEERIAFVVSFGRPGKDYAEEGRDKFLYGTEPVKDQKVFE